MNVLEQALEVMEAYCSGRLGSASTIAALKEAIANDTLKKQWQREALLEASCWFDDGYAIVPNSYVRDELRRMAKELET
jgi:hypothetical protein